MICSTVPIIFAQTNTSAITVTTDKSSYSDGDQMTLSGTVTAQLNVPMSFIIKDPSQNPVEIGQISVNPDNTYSTQVTTGGRLWSSSGTYEIDITYGSASNTAKTTFEFTSKTSGTPGNVVVTPGNQTVPEFGSMAPIVLVISVLSLVFYTRIRSSFKMI